MLNLVDQVPDVLHLHNLHGGYFDLRSLVALSKQLPTVVTLHDAWLLSGHCAHSLTCDRWKTGCGRCPDLSLYPSIRRDGTAINWRRKRRIYRRAKLRVATPCSWLLRRVEESILMESVQEARVIPNGVDTTLFSPPKHSRAEIRQRLDLPIDARVILCVGAGFRTSPWKDYASVEESVGRISLMLPKDQLILLMLSGESAPAGRIGAAEVRYVDKLQSERDIVPYYQAADVLLHTAHADTFPNVVIEAMACGLPVIGTRVGGIPEQIVHGDTGYLVTPGDIDSLVAHLRGILTSADRRSTLGENAVERVRHRFDVRRMVAEYLEWFGEIIAPSPGL